MTAPVIKETRLSNGMTLIHLHTPQDPISACHLFVPGGTDQENQKHSGITYLMWSLLAKGTEHRSARQIAEDIEGIGASIGAGSTHDYSEISCHATATYFVQALEIMGEMLFHPTFAASEVEKERAALLAGIRAKKESIFTIANEALNVRLYGNHPYGRPSSGNEETVTSITADDIVKWNKKSFIPNDAILVIATSVPLAKIQETVESIFGIAKWKKSTASDQKVIPTTGPVKEPQSVRLREKFEQAYLLIGYAAPRVDSKDYVPLKVLNAVLGGGMSARLFQQLREQEGLAYDVGAFYPSKKSGSAFVAYMGLQPSKLEEARKRMNHVFNEVLAKPIPAKEIAETKSYIKGSYILDHQTNSQRAHYLGWWKILGLGSGFDKQYAALLDKVTAQDVHRVTKKVLGSHPITVEIFPAKLGG